MTLILAVVLLVLSSVPAAAQDERIGIGASVTYVRPQSNDLTRAPLTLRPLLRLQPGAGWGIAGAFNWYDTEIDGSFAGVSGELADLETRPFMGGVGYTLRHGRLRTTFSVVGGPAWSRLRIREEVRTAFSAAGRNIDDTIDVASWAVRPGAGVSIRIAPRLDLTAFGGYLFNNPKFTIPTPTGDVENDWNGNAVVLSVGVVVAIF
jgi:hypothetical protein